MYLLGFLNVHRFPYTFHTARCEAAAQCIVIAPVCVFVGVFVGLLPR